MSWDDRGGWVHVQDGPRLVELPLRHLALPQVQGGRLPRLLCHQVLVGELFSLNFCKWGIFVEVELLSKLSFEVVEPA